MCKSYKFTIPIRPIGKARARITRWGSYTPAKTTAAEEAIVVYAKIAGVKPLEGPVEMRIDCYFKYPKNWSKKKRQLVGLSKFRPLKPDADNIGKLCADALNGIAYNDDAQIVDLHITKQYGEEDKIIIKTGGIPCQKIH